MTHRPPAGVPRRLSDHRSRWQVCTRSIGVRIDSTSSRAGQHLGQPVGVRRAGAARRLEHGPPLALADRRLEPLVHRAVGAGGRTPWRAASSAPTAAGSSPGRGRRCRPRRRPARARRRPRRRTAAGGAAARASGPPPASRRGGTARRPRLAAAPSASKGSNDSLTAQAAPVGDQPAYLTELAARHRLAQRLGAPQAERVGDRLGLHAPRVPECAGSRQARPTVGPVGPGSAVGGPVETRLSPRRRGWSRRSPARPGTAAGWRRTRRRRCRG